MYQTMTIFSKNLVFQNPVTQKHATLLMHNTTLVIVADGTVISMNDNNKANQLLSQMGYTIEVYDGHGDVQKIDL
ncbi:hypothetical protein [Paenibacillus taichungensis]